MNHRLPELLMVEDNPADVRLVQEAFAECNIHCNMSIARDGVEALAFLRREERYAQAARPDLIFLDLNLPRMDGREVLEAIKKDHELARTPVVILTTSRAESDIVQCYDLHANCYVVKPVELDAFFEIIRSVERFWFGSVSLPSR